MDNNALFKLSYGLFVLTARQGEKDNGCIINTAMQITDDPKRIAIAVNKQNLTHNMVLETGAFNLSVLSEEADSLTLSPTGVLSFQESGCVYPAVDGTVSEILQNADGTWTVKITHSDSFSEVISGLSYLSCTSGSTVKSNVPLGYSDGSVEVQVSMYEDGALLNCFYLAEDGTLAWTEE